MHEDGQELSTAGRLEALQGAIESIALRFKQTRPQVDIPAFIEWACKVLIHSADLKTDQDRLKEEHPPGSGYMLGFSDPLHPDPAVTKGLHAIYAENQICRTLKPGPHNKVAAEQLRASGIGSDSDDLASKQLRREA